MSNYDIYMKNKNKKSNGLSYFFVRFFNKFLITCLLTVVCLIFLKGNSDFKSFFNTNVIDVNFNFAYLNGLYGKYFGGVLPFSDFFESTESVFNESLVYSDSHDYLEGVSLSVSSNYLVPSIDNGLVVYIGDKEGYGNTVIIETSDGVNIWYSNMGNVNVSMYEYISKGSLIGNCDNNLYLVFKKDGNVLDYKKYI